MQYAEYIIHLAILIGIYLVLAQSLNLPFGLGKLFNLAHVASYSIGAYVTAICSRDFEFSFFSCFWLSLLVAGLLALIFGGIALRLTQDYFAVGTLALAALVTALLTNWKSLTYGVLGIPNIPKPSFWGINFEDNTNFMLLTYAVVVASFFVLWISFNSPLARTLRAQGEFEPAAFSLGKNTRLARNISFFIGSAIAGAAGSLYAYYMSYIDPSSFALHEMVFVLTIVVVGSPGSFKGCLAATVFLVLLPEPLRFVPLPAGVLGPLRQALYALILFGVIYVKRDKIFPKERTV